MAIAKGNASKEAQEFKRYIGVCPVFVKAVNPDKKEHENIFGTALEEAPVYVTDKEDADGKTYKNARISLVLAPDTEKVGFDMPLITMSLFISNKKQFGSTSGKYQIVDKYGRFAWATEAEISAKQVPTYSTGRKADIDTDYRIACVGEEDLTNFIRTFLCIPNVSKWDAETRTMIPNKDVKPEDCECRLDTESLAKVFKGDFSEIKDILGLQPNNKIKVCLGVRTDINTGRLYQSVYTKRFMSNSSNNYNALDKDLQADIVYAQEHGKTLNTEYSAEAVHEYSVTPTEFTAPAAAPADPLETSSSDSELPWA